MSLVINKQQLIEEIGLRLENTLHIAPLAARIYALLTLSPSEGLTFEEIRKIIASSKSSTSVNLNVLTQLQQIKYYTKPGDRKRYYKIAKDFQLTTLAVHQQNLASEIELVEKINSYNKIHYPDKFVQQKSLGDLTQDYLREMQSLVRKTIKKITAFHQTNG